MSTKRFPAFFAALLALCGASAQVRADLIKQSQTGGYERTFGISQTANPLLGLTGATPVVKIRKKGGTYITATNAAAEVDSANDPGRYKIIFTAAEINTIGVLDAAVTATGGNPEWLHDVVYDPLDYGITAAAIAANILTTPSNLLQTDAGGRVILQPGEHTNIRADVDAILNTAIPGSPTTGSSYAALRTAANPPDFWAALTSSYNGAGTFGLFVKTQLANAVPAFPANFGSLSITLGGLVNVNLAQALDTSNTGDTVGGGLIAARAQGFGKWVIGSDHILKLYAADGTTLLRSFAVSPQPVAQSRQ